MAKPARTLYTALWVPLAFATVAVGSPAAAQAQKPHRDPSVLFDECVRLGEASRWTEAATCYEEVVRLKPVSPAFAALGYAEMQLGHLLTARTLAVRAIAEAKGDEALRRAQALLKEVKALLPRVALVSSPGTALAVAQMAVQVDGEPAVIEDDAIVLADPGDHDVVVTGSGGNFRSKVFLEKGQRTELVVRFAQPGTGGARKGDEPAGRGDWGGPPTGAIVLGIGGALVGVYGLTEWLGGKSDFDGATADCAIKCPIERKDDVDSARSRIVTGQLLTGLGTAAVAGGALWWWLTPPQGTSSTSMSVGPRGMGAEVRWRF